MRVCLEEVCLEKNPCPDFFSLSEEEQIASSKVIQMGKGLPLDLELPSFFYSLARLTRLRLTTPSKDDFAREAIFRKVHRDVKPNRKNISRLSDEKDCARSLPQYPYSFERNAVTHNSFLVSNSIWYDIDALYVVPQEYHVLAHSRGSSRETQRLVNSFKVPWFFEHFVAADESAELIRQTAKEYDASTTIDALSEHNCPVRIAYQELTFDLVRYGSALKGREFGLQLPQHALVKIERSLLGRSSSSKEASLYKFLQRYGFGTTRLVCALWRHNIFETEFASQLAGYNQTTSDVRIMMLSPGYATACAGSVGMFGRCIRAKPMNYNPWVDLTFDFSDLETNTKNNGLYMIVPQS